MLLELYITFPNCSLPYRRETVIRIITTHYLLAFILHWFMYVLNGEKFTGFSWSSDKLGSSSQAYFFQAAWQLDAKIENQLCCKPG